MATDERRATVSVPSAVSASLERDPAGKGTNLEKQIAIGALPALPMRVRITKALRGTVDGMQLSRLLKGHVYDLYTTLACYLLSEEVAEPATDREPAGIVWAENLSRSITLPRAVAAERGRRKKPRN